MTYAHLTDAEIRKLVAERLGWKWYQGYVEQQKYAILTKSYRVWEQVVAPDDDADALIDGDCPNWPGSIADAYALEESVPEEGREEYAEILAGIVDQLAHFFALEVVTDIGNPPRTRVFDRIIVHEYEQPRKFAYALAHSTARQKCEAWLMYMDEAAQ